MSPLLNLTLFERLMLITNLLAVTIPHHDESYSPHKDRNDQRFHVEKFSDSGNYHVPVTGGFMTSTPQTKSQAVFSPPRSSQVRQQFICILICILYLFYNLAFSYLAFFCLKNLF